MSPLVSILIPAFNAEPCIAETIQSALDQTWQDKEIVIVDDGSSDRTLAIAQRFASKNVKVVSQPNQGAATARNRAYSVCEGDYIQWLDADDILAPDKIAKQMHMVADSDRKRVLLSCAWGHFNYRPSNAKFVRSPLWCDLAPLELLLRKWENGVFMQPAAWLLSRELAEAAGPWDTRLSLDDDGEYFCRVILVSEEVKFVPEARIFYRRGFDTLSCVGEFDKKLDSKFLSTRLQVEHLRAIDDSARVRAACVKSMEADLFHFHPERPDIVSQAQQLAAQLGGKLGLPQISWKYRPIEKAFGLNAAKRAQRYLSRWKFSAINAWDKLLFRFERECIG